MANNFYYYEDRIIPYRVSQVCDCVTQYAKEYVQEADRMIDNIDTKVRDLVLVDSINYMGGNGYIDYGLDTECLYDGKTCEKEVDSQCLLTTLVIQYGYYMFSWGIVKFPSKHMKECVKPFDNDGARVLIDFINYVAEKNNYDRIFTIEEIYKKLASILKHKSSFGMVTLVENAYNYIDLFEDGESFILGVIDNKDMEHISQYIELKKQSLSNLVKEIDTINGPSGVTKTKRIPINKEYRESVKRANERIKASHDVYSEAALKAKDVYALKRTK